MDMNNVISVLLAKPEKRWNQSAAGKITPLRSEWNVENPIACSSHRFSERTDIMFGRQYIAGISGTNPLFGAAYEHHLHSRTFQTSHDVQDPFHFTLTLYFMVETIDAEAAALRTDEELMSADLTLLEGT